MIRVFVGTMVLVAGLFASSSIAQTLNVPNTFQSGTPARASEVNENFDAVASAVNKNTIDVAALVERIAVLEARVAEYEDRLSAIEGNELLELQGLLELDRSEPDVPRVVFKGVNLQIVNGLGSTNSVNGLGNLIIGYDEGGTASESICTDGTWWVQQECEGRGAIWTDEIFKIGSHSLVLGTNNRYSSYGGLVAGQWNTINNPGATVSGGEGNIAAGYYSSVSGGWDNVAVGTLSNITGGAGNRAMGYISSIGGGAGNETAGEMSSVSGGRLNTAAGAWSTVSGGAENTADVDDSHVP